MKRCSTVDLRKMEVVNVCDGAILGYVCDFEFDQCDGKILALIIPGERGILGNCKTADIVIPWCRIERFGEDAILVKLPPDECIPKCEKRRRKFFIFL